MIARINDKLKQSMLASEVRSCVRLGCEDMTASFGIQKMPLGYALILDADKMYFSWIRYDGVESCIDWNKWNAWRGAVADSKNPYVKPSYVPFQ